MPMHKTNGDKEKKSKIRKALQELGTAYINEIARHAGLAKSTTYLYLKTFMANEVEIVNVVEGEKMGRLVVYYKLR